MITTFKDIGRADCARRTYRTTGNPEPRAFTIICPYCRGSTVAFVRSLNGSGKRCECGALFTSRRNAYKLKVVK